MSSRVTSQAAMAQAEMDAVFASLEHDWTSYIAEFEGDGIRVVCREEVAALTFHMIEKVRGHICGLRAIVEELGSNGDEAGYLRAARFERDVLSPLASGLIVGMLLELNRLLCRPFLVFPYQAQVAALIARNAAIEGDRATVAVFAKRVLGEKHTARWRKAMEMALLGDWVALLGTGRATRPYVHDVLRRHAAVEHRHLQPVWEGRIRGERTVLLGQSIDGTRTIADLLVEHRSPEQVLLSNAVGLRVSTVLRHLSAEELTLALAWAERGGAWPEVAKDFNQDRQFGERVRRKLKRLGRHHTDRAAEAERTTRRMQ
ncbi:hypothetical protein [Streptomyces chartreusis]|uniref:hypothetical protein n=1 Tax=Streptomyces chartreusis TaxID=1969 RepID=UPI003821D32A